MYGTFKIQGENMTKTRYRYTLILLILVIPALSILTSAGQESITREENENCDLAYWPTIYGPGTLNGTVDLSYGSLYPYIDSAPGPLLSGSLYIWTNIP